MKRLPDTADEEWAEQMEARKKLAEQRMEAHDEHQPNPRTERIGTTERYLQ